MDAREALAALLDRLEAGEDALGVRDDARRLLAVLDADDQVRAEHELLDAGFLPEGLGPLVPGYALIWDKALAALRQGRPGEHVLATFVAEHDVLLDHLDRILHLNRYVQRLAEFPQDEAMFGELDDLAERLAASDNHHLREEAVLYRAMEMRGIIGPAVAMKSEHSDLTALARQLTGLAECADTLGIQVFKTRLNAVAQPLFHHLRHHVSKENNVIFPQALTAIHAEEEWAELKDECDEIGYCCLTPANVGLV